jgi:uncharacterized membrane protein YgcG
MRSVRRDRFEAYIWTRFVSPRMTRSLCIAPLEVVPEYFLAWRHAARDALRLEHARLCWSRVRIGPGILLPCIILGLWMGFGGHRGWCMLQRDMLYACHLIHVHTPLSQSPAAALQHRRCQTATAPPSVPYVPGAHRFLQYKLCTDARPTPRLHHPTQENRAWMAPLGSTPDRSESIYIDQRLYEAVFVLNCVRIKGLLSKTVSESRSSADHGNPCRRSRWRARGGEAGSGDGGGGAHRLPLGRVPLGAALQTHSAYAAC